MTTSNPSPLSPTSKPPEAAPAHAVPKLADELRELPRRTFSIPKSPVLRFTPTAWAKLQFFCHRGDTEIGGFGIASAEDLLLIEDFVTVAQRTTSVTVAFDDTAVADFFEDQVDRGLQPEQFARVWLHTHPGDSPTPSMVDEETFERVFGSCHWAVMAILARGGKTYARLRFNVGPGGQALIPVEIDYRQEFQASDHLAWQAEYDHHIHCDVMAEFGVGRQLASARKSRKEKDPFADFDFFHNLEEFEAPASLYEGIYEVEP